MAIGMGALLLAGAGSFYFAKKEIDARRRLQNEAGTRPIEKRNWYERLDDVPLNTAATLPAKGPPNTNKTLGDDGSSIR